ncbi:MAG: DUF4360 domain-containing protein [Nostoc sp.]|uniref:DUF4360 domain-containing protein n=1 Tax=Nostoc sp. TaxID=1180 RepID=UPI002FFBFB68
MNIKIFGVLLSISTIFGVNVIATKTLADVSPSITFRKAIASGGGCIVTDQLLGSDGRSLSLLLDKFNAKEGARQRCILRIDTIIPSGFIVQNVEILYQGSVDVKSLSKGTTLSRSYIFNGGALGGITSARPIVTQFKSSDPLFQEQDDIFVASASCGGQGQLGINLIAQSTSGSSIFVDSADLSAGDVLLRIDLAPCSS